MDWPTFDKEIDQLISKIDIKPDLIIGIARGGVIPAVAVANRLGIEQFHALKVIRNGDKREIITKVTEIIEGKVVLLVDDMLESGKGSKLAKEYLEDKGAKVVVACFYVMPETKQEIVPDYFLKTVDEIIKFPWE
ncbi:hypothetical protein HOE31_01185 [bacterium]|jgi:uncharacterized protein|nr:hypothetical protein [bacterium]MBT4121546.1 hypothetical protein [bacterium]MBT4495195.1 hypothetical protein [bacterium]MBT4763682.1 hypothetical protein [bacterium]MBT5401053.1 hypothetical protein [bacterium]